MLPWVGSFVVFRLKESERTVTNAFLFAVFGMQVLFCECVLVLLAR